MAIRIQVICQFTCEVTMNTNPHISHITQYCIIIYTNNAILIEHTCIIWHNSDAQLHIAQNIKQSIKIADILNSVLFFQILISKI